MVDILFGVEMPASNRYDISWGAIQERRTYSGATWIAPTENASEIVNRLPGYLGHGFKFDPEDAVEKKIGTRRKLQVVKLKNGLWYANALDADTDQTVFDASELTGENDFINGRFVVRRNMQARCLSGTNLGDNYTLRSLSLHPGSEKEPRSAESDVYTLKRKYVGTGEISHRFRYQIDPYRESFSGSYQFIDTKGAYQIGMKTKKNRGGVMGGPELNYSLAVGDLFSMYGSKVFWRFSPEGELEEVVLENIGISSVNGSDDIETFSRSEGRPQVFNKDQIKANQGLIKALNARLLGIEDQGNLTIDRQGTLNALIKNIDNEQSKNPQEVVIFKNARRISDWSLRPLELQ